MWQAIGYLFLAALLFVFGTVVWPEMAEKRCTGRWKESGLNARQESQWLGCMVQVNGRWIPEANVQISP